MRPFVPGGAVGANFSLGGGAGFVAVAASSFVGVVWRFVEADPVCGPGSYVLTEARIGVSLASGAASAAVSFLVALFANDPVTGLPTQPAVALTTAAATLSAGGAPSLVVLPLLAPFEADSSVDGGANYTLAFLPSVAVQWASPADGVARHVPADGFGRVLDAVTSANGGATWAPAAAGAAFGAVELFATKVVCAPTPSQSASYSLSATGSASSTQSASASASQSVSPSPSASPSQTLSSSPSQTASESLTRSGTPSASQEVTRSATPSRTTTATATGHPEQAVWDNTGGGALPVDAGAFALIPGSGTAGVLGVSWTFPEADPTCAWGVGGSLR